MNGKPFSQYIAKILGTLKQDMPQVSIPIQCENGLLTLLHVQLEAQTEPYGHDINRIGSDASGFSVGGTLLMGLLALNMDQRQSGSGNSS